MAHAAHSPERFALRAAPTLFVFLWSTGFIGAKFGLPYAEPLTFLALRMAIVVLLFGLIAIATKPRWPNATGAMHSAVVGALVHVLYLGGVFTAISQGVPAGISALIPGLQPILTSTIANRWLGERVGALQWMGLALGLIGVAFVLHDRTIVGGNLAGWIATFVSLIGITLGTLYQKRHCGGIDWRAGNFIQYIAAFILFALGALLFETRAIRWSGEFAFALAWLVAVMSFGAVGLMYWLIRRQAATSMASLFYLVPGVTALFAFAIFGERLDLVSLIGMAICAIGVALVNWRRA